MKRKSRCGECLACLASNCRSCSFCLDMTQYGGKGQMKQACSNRICSKKNMKSAKKSFKSSAGIEDTIPPRRGRKCNKIKFDELQKPQYVIQNAENNESGKKIYTVPYNNKDENNLSSVKAPPKRGRSPKNKETFNHKSMDKDSEDKEESNKDENNLSSVKVPPKRGRPSKNKENFCHKVRISHTKPSSSTVYDDLNRDTSEEMIKDEDKLSSIKVPRKRGRPRKNKEHFSHKVRTPQVKPSSSSTVSHKILQKKQKTVDESMKVGGDANEHNNDNVTNDNEDVGILNRKGSDITFIKSFNTEQGRQVEEAQDMEEEVESKKVQQYHNGDIAQRIKSSGNLTVKIGSGEASKKVDLVEGDSSSFTEGESISSDDDEEENIFSVSDNDLTLDQDKQDEEAQDMEKDEQSKKVQEKFVHTPATMSIKQENSFDKDIQIEYENLLKTPTTLSIKQENENLETHDSGPPVFCGTSTQPPGTSEFPVNCQHQEVPRYVNSATPLPSAPKGVTIIPIGSPSSNFSSIGLSGSTPIGSSAGNSSSTGPSGQTNGRIHNGDIGQRTKASGNLTVKIGNGDININNGGCTVQIKLEDVSIAGDADEVIKLVTLSKQWKSICNGK